MRKLRLFVMLALILGTFGTSLLAQGGGWSETIYYDSETWNYAVGGHRVDGCNPANNSNWGTTSTYREVAGDSCDGYQYSCQGCAYIDGMWTCYYTCIHDH
jgi:hypothetical protein